MYGRFTQRAQRAIAQAQKEAAALHQRYVGTEHLLIALLRTDDNLPGEVRRCVDADKAASVLLSNGLDPTGSPVPTRYEMTPRMKKLLDQAIAESHEHGQSYVTAEHLWLGLLSDRESLACSILTKCGLDFDRTHTQLEALLDEGVSEEAALEKARKYLEAGMSKKDAARLAAEETGVPKNALYDMIKNK